MKCKHAIVALSLVFVFLLGYWAKNQIGIDIFDFGSLSGYFPFSYLQRNDVIEDPRQGILFEENFDSHSLVRHWGGLWMREKGKVAKEVAREGRDGSRCLVVKSTSDESWSLGYSAFVRVKEGDVFEFKGWVYQEGSVPGAYLRVTSYDEKKAAIKWNYVAQKNSRTGKWDLVERTFTVGGDVAYLKFGLVGRGEGEFRFDDLVFRKE